MSVSLHLHFCFNSLKQIWYTQPFYVLAKLFCWMLCYYCAYLKIFRNKQKLVLGLYSFAFMSVLQHLFQQRFLL